MKTLIPNLYEINEKKLWNKSLKKYGFVVIKNILTKDEKDTIYNQFKIDLNTVSPNFDFNNHDTWTIENTPIMFGKGMAVFNGFGQSDFMWMLRLNKNIQKIYQKIYKTKKLVTSFDGFSLYVSKKQKSKLWLHIDQSPANDIYSVQGQYNFFSVDKEDSGFIIIPKSHKKFKPKTHKLNDWYMLKNDDLESLDEPVKLVIPENCFTLWDSRLVHANTFTTKNKLETINRVTAYITFLPKELRSKEIKKERIEAYKNSKTTSHWANKCEIKKYPYGFGPRFELRGFNNIIAKLSSGNIPKDRLKLI